MHFLPPRTGAELPLLYQAADLVAVPSYNESFGLVALEAQACGTPVVAAAVGGLSPRCATSQRGAGARTRPGGLGGCAGRLLPTGTAELTASRC